MIQTLNCCKIIVTSQFNSQTHSLPFFGEGNIKTEYRNNKISSKNSHYYCFVEFSLIYKVIKCTLPAWIRSNPFESAPLLFAFAHQIYETHAQVLLIKGNNFPLTFYESKRLQANSPMKEEQRRKTLIWNSIKIYVVFARMWLIQSNEWREHAHPNKGPKKCTMWKLDAVQNVQKVDALWQRKAAVIQWKLFV